MIRTLIALRLQILHQETTLATQRRDLTLRYHDLKAHYRRRLSSPTALATSLAAGLIVGTLRARRQRVRETTAKTKHPMLRWLSPVRAIVGPALIHALRTKAIELLLNPRSSE